MKHSVKARASSFSSIPVTPKQLPARRSGLLKPPEEKSERGAPAIGDSHAQRSTATSTHTGRCIYQPDKSGIVFMPRVHSELGAEVLRSTDYGETWSHVGIAMEQAVVFGTPKRVYAMYAWACGRCLLDPALQSAPQPGSSGWARMSTPAGMAIGPAQNRDSLDGANYITLTANWRGGLWRFVE
jgi:hypothetical protein